MIKLTGLDWVIETVKSLMATKFTGVVHINLFKGGITSINFYGTAKPGERLAVSITE